MGERAPAFQLYADDFLAGTMDLSQAEVGAYIRLLCHQWSKGFIPSDTEKQCRLAGGAVSAEVLAKFKACDDGSLRNQRLESVRVERERFISAQSNNGKLGAEKRWHRHNLANGQTMATPIAVPSSGQWPNHSSPTPTPTPTPAPTPTPSPSPSPTPEVGSRRVRRPAASRTSDEIIAEFQKQEAYEWINVSLEWNKMAFWCSKNGKQPTERRFVKWLNRIERPINGTTSLATDPQVARRNAEMGYDQTIADAHARRVAEIEAGKHSGLPGI